MSLQLNVGVLLVRPNGQVALPHSMCTGGEGASGPAAQLAEFVARLKQEPLLLKAYTAQAIVSMQARADLTSRAGATRRACKAARAVSCSCRTGSRRRTSRRTLSGRASR